MRSDNMRAVLADLHAMGMLCTGCEKCAAFGILAPFGQEVTAEEHRARASYERYLGRSVASRPWGAIIATGHARCADAYDRRADEIDATPSLPQTDETDR